LSKNNDLNQKLFNLTHQEANQCVQCGYCLPVCPTYESMGKETASPRGRINLVKLAAEGKIDVREHLASPIDMCLGCRACETACPVGVPYGHILESAKEVIAEAHENHKPESKSDRRKQKAAQFVMRHLFPFPKRLRLVGNLVWFSQKTGMAALLRKTKLLRVISEPMAAFEEAVPPMEIRRHRFGSVYPAKGRKKARVAFFAGCIVDAMMSQLNRLTIELLTLSGCEVIIPQAQSCCGALHAHQGLKEAAVHLAKQNITAFEQSGADYYVHNAGGCGAMLCEYGHLLSGDQDWADRANEFASKSRDITQILVQFGPLPYQSAWEGKITYQDSCHLRNVQGVVDEPRTLLQSIPGATYVELEGSHLCCASGGIYNLLHYDESMKILEDKMKKANATDAATIVTTNPGCLLQMRVGVRNHGQITQQEAVHIVEVLAKVCGIQ
jgi:glycolate oxidase iron-sulfur subunit